MSDRTFKPPTELLPPISEFKPKDAAVPAAADAPYPAIRWGGPTMADAANDAWGSKKQDKTRNEKNPLHPREHEGNFFKTKVAGAILKFLIPVVGLTTSQPLEMPIESGCIKL
jgi:hypothetical protein